MNIQTQVFYGYLLSFLLNKYLIVDLLGHKLSLFLTMLETAKLFLNLAGPFYIPTSNI